MALQQQVKKSNRGISLFSLKQRQAFGRFNQALGEWLLNSWATIITIVLGVIVATALAIPFLSYFGLDVTAKPLFYCLHFILDHGPSHSFYNFEQQRRLCDHKLTI